MLQASFFYSAFLCISASAYNIKIKGFNKFIYIG